MEGFSLSLALSLSLSLSLAQRERERERERENTTDEKMFAFIKPHSLSCEVFMMDCHCGSDQLQSVEVPPPA